MLAEFRALFTGGEEGYGRWNPKKVERGEDPVSTWKGAAPLEAYEQHLKGEIGLGIAPATTQGVCHFAAIDIDIDNINHAELYSLVQQHGLPLHVCRSKSGGAHLYMFMRPPLPATKVIATLKQWAATLGFPRSEIFPKQAKLSVKNKGSWINLPYFGGDNTTRYCIGPHGALTLQEFLDSIQYFDPDKPIKAEVAEVVHEAEMPPCLKTLAQNPLPPGSRNTVMFNMAVFYRKSQPHNWEDAVNKHNIQHCDPPLQWREINTIVQSAARAKYHYTCEQEPMCGLCDRTACQKLPFGVGHKAWQEPGTFDELLVTKLRKISSKPPRYVVEVNGRDLEIAAEEFLTFNVFRRIVYTTMDLMVQPMKQQQWEQLIKEITASKIDIEAPEDASFDGLVLERFHDFLALRERAINREDILRGLPYLEGDTILFKASDFKRHLQIYKMDKLEPSYMFSILKNAGCTHTRVRVSGKLMLLWQYPLNKANTQTEDFEIPQFEVKGGDDL